MVSAMLSSSMIGPSLPPGWQPPSDASAARQPRNAQIHASNGPVEPPTGSMPSACSSQSAVALPPVLLSWWPNHDGVGCGLRNLGNSCYLNSILQCLAYLPPLGQRCTAHLHSKVCPRKADGNVNCAACIVEGRLSRCLHGCPGTPEAPQRLWNHLHLISRELRRGSQEDAHEALRMLVEAVHRDMLRAAYGWGFKPNPKEKEPTTPISQLFEGEVQSQVKCTVCGHCSNRLETTMDLSLEVQGCRTIYEALDKFTVVERLEGDNRYQCDKCRRLVAARKQFTIQKAPHVLVIHLKRFDVFGGKIGSMVSFPEQLSLSQYLSKGPHEGQPPAEYRLCGATIHEGSTRLHGHYHAMVQDPKGVWYNMDDCIVTRASRSEVLAQRAYLLFYVRRPGAVPNAEAVASPSCKATPASWAPGGVRSTGTKRPEISVPDLPGTKARRLAGTNATFAPRSVQIGPSLPPGPLQLQPTPAVIGPQLPPPQQQAGRPVAHDLAGTVAKKLREQLKAKVRRWCRSGPMMQRILNEARAQPSRMGALHTEVRAAAADRPDEVLGSQETFRQALSETEQLVDSCSTRT